MTGISRLTALIIRNSDDVFAASTGPDFDGKYGLFIGRGELSHIGNYRELLTSTRSMWSTHEEALAAAQKIIDEIRAVPEDHIMLNTKIEEPDSTVTATLSRTVDAGEFCG